MLHLRMRVPADLLDDVLAMLCGDPTVTNVAVHRDAYRSPPGAMVLADAAKENATSVVEKLRDLHLDTEGSITLDPIDTVLSRDAIAAERAAPGAPDDGVVWEQVEQKLRADSRLTGVFVAFLTLALLIAGVGRLLDQPILIVGAMVVGPDFTPVAAICLALALPRPSMLLPALRTLVLGFVIATGIAVAVWLVSFHLGAFTRTQASSGRLTEFIVSPDAWSFVVACLAGVAGTLSLTTAKSGPLVGVFISVTTVPAAGTMAICLATGLWGEVGSTLLQLGVNIGGMLVAGTLAILAQRLIWRSVANRAARHPTEDV